jgi:hypothetical protein
VKTHSLGEIRDRGSHEKFCDDMYFVRRSRREEEEENFLAQRGIATALVFVNINVDSSGVRPYRGFENFLVISGWFLSIAVSRFGNRRRDGPTDCL